MSSTVPAMDAGPSATAASVSWRVSGFWRFNGINTFWAVNQGLWNALYVLLAISAAVTAPTQKELVVGRATAAGGVLAVLVPISVGWLSDRTRSQLGRRTPWIAGGALIGALGLVLLAWAPSVPVLIASYLVLQLGNNAAGAAFAGIVPDAISEERRGRASGLLNSATIVGTVVCLAISLIVLGALGSSAHGAATTYWILAAMTVTSAAFSILLLREPGSKSLGDQRAKEAPTANRRPALGVLMQVWHAMMANPDFCWVITTRFFLTLGIWTILPFLAFYFKDVVRTSNYGAASDLWQLVVLAGGLAPAIVCGYLSDRTRRRKLFVYFSSGMQGVVVAVLLFTLVSDLPTIYVLGLAFGIGYGAYSAVDWALACDVLPDREHSAARDMGIFHVAYTLPQVFAPALLAPILYRLNQPGHIAALATGPGTGYRVVFATAAVWFLLATLMVRRIRGVR